MDSDKLNPPNPMGRTSKGWRLGQHFVIDYGPDGLALLWVVFIGLPTAACWGPFPIPE